MLAWDVAAALWAGVPAWPEGAAGGFVGVGTFGDFGGGAAVDGILTAKDNKNCYLM